MKLFHELMLNELYLLLVTISHKTRTLRNPNYGGSINPNY